MKQTEVDRVPTKVIDKCVASFKDKPGELLGLLEAVQQSHPHKYLPPETLEYIAQKTGISPAKIYSVVTFYAFFNLKPQGDHTIVVCRGTACHTRNSRNILESIGTLLGFTEKELTEGGEKIFLTTKDKKFTIKTVACFGQCALAPVVEVDGIIYSNVTQEKVRRIIRKIDGR